MPQFFFDIAGETQVDADGVELADLEEARSQAIKFTGEMLRHDSNAIWDGHSLRVEVSDSRRRLLFVVTVLVTSIFPGS